MRAMPISPLMGCPNGSREASRRQRKSVSRRSCWIAPEALPRKSSAKARPRRGCPRLRRQNRLYEYGPNVVAQEQRHPKLTLLLHALVNPLVILLAVLAAISFSTEDYRAGSVMSLMVILGVVLRFVQEARAGYRRCQAPGHDQCKSDRPSRRPIKRCTARGACSR